MATALVLEAAHGRENGRFKYGEVDFATLQNPSGFKSQVSRCGVVLDYARDLAAEIGPKPAGNRTYAAHFACFVSVFLAGGYA